MRKLTLLAAAAAFLLSACRTAAPEPSPPPSPTPAPTAEPRQVTVFLDAGHGKPSSQMSDEEKTQYGWVQNQNGEWGEWRHWRGGEYGVDCEGDDGIEQEGDCRYPIENGDRDIEPEINLRNCMSAKNYLEQMGYKVIMSRESSDENPSVTKRISDAQNANADLYICVHSNAGGGSGTSYVAASADNNYYATHRGDNGEFAARGNTLGKIINDKIADETSLSVHGSGCIDFEPYLILFQKAPMVCAYLEIGFFDNENDLNILNGEYDRIGHALADGIDEYRGLYMN